MPTHRCEQDSSFSPQKSRRPLFGEGPSNWTFNSKSRILSLARRRSSGHVLIFGRPLPRVVVAASCLTSARKNSTKNIVLLLRNSSPSMPTISQRGVNTDCHCALRILECLGGPSGNREKSRAPTSRFSTVGKTRRSHRPLSVVMRPVVERLLGADSSRGESGIEVRSSHRLTFG